MGLFRGHNTTIRENKISDFEVSTAQYGSTVPEILGTTRISPNVIYWDDFTAHEHKTSQKSGKGGHSKTTQITYTYTVAVILALCEGPVSGIGKSGKTKIYTNIRTKNWGLLFSPGLPTRSPGLTYPGSTRIRLCHIAAWRTWRELLTWAMPDRCRSTISRSKGSS